MKNAARQSPHQQHYKSYMQIVIIIWGSYESDGIRVALYILLLQVSRRYPQKYVANQRSAHFQAPWTLKQRRHDRDHQEGPQQPRSEKRTNLDNNKSNITYIRSSQIALIVYKSITNLQQYGITEKDQLKRHQLHFIAAQKMNKDAFFPFQGGQRCFFFFSGGTTNTGHLSQTKS